MALVDLLKSVGLFDGLTDDQLERLIAISREEHYNDEDLIFEQNTEGDTLYFIREGQVEVLIRYQPHEPPRSHVFLGRGQIFGEMALIDFGKRSASIRCSRDGTILHAFSRQEFYTLCAQDTAIGFIVMRNMAMDLSFKLRHANLGRGASVR